MILNEELDALRGLQKTAEQQMYAAARKFPMWRTLQTAPGIGRKRAALLLAIVITPHRFRNKRRFWSYCGLGGRDEARPRIGSVSQTARMLWVPVIQTRGLNKACNRPAEGSLQGGRSDRQALRADARRVRAPARGGTKPNLARLTIARKIAATVLAMWKSESEYRVMS